MSKITESREGKPLAGREGAYSEVRRFTAGEFGRGSDGTQLAQNRLPWHTSGTQFPRLGLLGVSCFQ